MDTQLEKALEKVDAYIEEHPQYSRIDVEQPGQGSTNRVIFAREGSR